MQKCADLVGLQKYYKIFVYLQKSASTQPRTSPDKFWKSTNRNSQPSKSKKKAYHWWIQLKSQPSTQLGSSRWQAPRALLGQVRGEVVPGVQLAAQKHQGVFAATTGERNDPKSRLAIPIFSAKSREVSQMFCCFLYNFGQFADLRCFSGISDFPQFRQISMKNLDEKSPNLTKIKQQVSYKFAYIRKKL